MTLKIRKLLVTQLSFRNLALRPLLFLGFTFCLNANEEVASQSGLWMNWLSKQPGQWPMTRYYQKKPALLDRWEDGDVHRRTRVGQRKPPENRERFPRVDNRRRTSADRRRELHGGAPRYSFAQDRRRKETDRPPYRQYPEFVYYYNCVVSPWTERYPPRVLFRRNQENVRFEEVKTNVEGRFSQSWRTY